MSDDDEPSVTADDDGSFQDEREQAEMDVEQPEMDRQQVVTTGDTAIMSMATTVERPNAKALRRAAMQAPEWFTSMKLRALLDLIEQVDTAKGCVDQLWAESPLGEHLGGGFRLYAQFPSITKLAKDIQAIAVADYLSCVELKNCYPCILSAIFDVAALASYVNTRESILRQTAHFYGVCHDDADALYLRLSLKDTLVAWEVDCGYCGSAHFGFAVEYENAIRTVCNEIIQTHEDMYEKITKWIDPVTGEPVKHAASTLLKYVLQRTERRCLDAMRAVPGYITVAVLHKEIMIEKVGDDGALLEAMNAAVGAVVPGMACEIKANVLPNWFQPEKECWFEKLTKYEPIDLRNHIPATDDAFHFRELCLRDKKSPGSGYQDDTFCISHAYKCGLKTFSVQSMMDHLKRQKIRDPRVLINNYKMEKEQEQVRSYGEYLMSKVERWYYRHFFALVTKDKGMVAEQSGGQLFTMSQPQFKAKRGGDVMLIHSGKPRGIFDGIPDSRRVDAVDYYPINAPPNIINTFTGFAVEPVPVPMANLTDEMEQQVNAGLQWVDDHLRKVIANGDEPTYIFVRNVIAHIFQCRGKLRIFLQIYSVFQQAGKGIFFDDFLGAILGDNHHKPTAGLCDDEGLLGKFNWTHHSKLLILLDENGEFVFNRSAHGKLRTWLSAKRVAYTQKNCTAVEMNDYACLIALTNDLMSMRVEHKGDARSAPIHINEGYSMASAEAGEIVDGEPMTVERRAQYFKDGANYMLSEEIGVHVQRAFLHKMLQIDLTDYDFQSNIPKNDLRAQLSDVADEDAYLDDFVDAWAAGELYYVYRDDTKCLLTNGSPQTPEWYQLKSVWQAFETWHKDTQVDTRNCRSSGQLVSKLSIRRLLGDLNATAPNFPLWRKKGAGNVRMYCCNKRGPRIED